MPSKVLFATEQEALGVAERANSTSLGPLHGALLHCHAHFGLSKTMPLYGTQRCRAFLRGPSPRPHCTDTAPAAKARPRLEGFCDENGAAPSPSPWPSRSAKAAKASSVLLAAA